LAKKIVDENLSVRQTEEAAKVKAKSHIKKKKETEKFINPVFVDITEKLQRKLGTRVKLKGDEKRGKIEIESFSEDELERILEILL